MPRAHDSSRMRMGVLEKPLPATPPAAHPPTLHSAQPLLPLTGKLESGEGTLQPHVKRPCGTGSKVRDPNFKACGEVSEWVPNRFTCTVMHRRAPL
ncbi:hypothetical protein GE21DRAFT_1278792 [Neurospora crassa]|nr:hypothetical protein GE21DRAFT_1278792 [Neurospora crassa]